MKEKGILYLIPSPIADVSVDTISSFNLSILRSLDEFIVEDIRTARRFLIKAGIGRPIEELTFHVLNEHTKSESINECVEPLINGKNVGLLSDAGCPVIADPGALVIQVAHEKQIKIVPLVGPSSVLLALMASGLNGQNFTFHGYLPKQTQDRVKKLKQLETQALKEGSTHIFIETPYRNDSIVKDILASCSNGTLLCIASDITAPSEYIRTMSIAEWKKEKLTFNDHPTVFLLGSSNRQRPQ